MDDEETRPATPEEKRVIITHDCAMEILTLPIEERRGVLEALSSLVLPELPEPPEKVDPLVNFANGALALIENFLAASTPRTPPPEDVQPTTMVPDPQMASLVGLARSLSAEQKTDLVRLLSSEQRAVFTRIFGIDLPDLPEAH